MVHMDDVPMDEKSCSLQKIEVKNADGSVSVQEAWVCDFDPASEETDKVGVPGGKPCPFCGAASEHQKKKWT